MVTNNETSHVVQAVKDYRAGGGRSTWIAQLNCLSKPNMLTPSTRPRQSGAGRPYFHGWQMEQLYVKRDAQTVASGALTPARRACGSVWRARAGGALGWTAWTWRTSMPCRSSLREPAQRQGRTFSLRDMAAAVDCIAASASLHRLQDHGAGRIDARMAFEYAFESIKPTDVVNVACTAGQRRDGGRGCRIVRQMLT